MYSALEDVLPGDPRQLQRTVPGTGDGRQALDAERCLECQSMMQVAPPQST